MMFGGAAGDETIDGKAATCLCGGLSLSRPVAAMDIAGLSTEIAALAKIDAAVVARRSRVIAELNRRRSDAAERLRNAGGMSGRDANRAAKNAEGLEKLPKTREALEKGEITPGQAEQLASRANNPDRARDVRDNEEQLLDDARDRSTDDFRRHMRRRDVEDSPDNGNSLAQKQRQMRKGSMWVDDDTGMHCLSAEWDPVTGALVSNKLQAMVERIWRSENGPKVRTKRRVAQRRADALAALILHDTGATAGTTDTGNTAAGTSDAATGAAAGMDTGNPSGESASPDSGDVTPAGGAPSPDNSSTPDGGSGSTSESDGQQGFNFDDPTPERATPTPDRPTPDVSPTPSGHPAPVPTPGSAPTPSSSSSPSTGRASEPGLVPVPPPPSNIQMLIIANYDALQGILTGGTLPNGTPLPADTINRMACDAELVPAIYDSDRQPLRLGRSRRLATPTQRIAVTARDLGCIVCGAAPEYCQVHHIAWWSAGGSTDIENLCLVCATHHTMIHERGLTIANTPGGMKVEPPGGERTVRSVPDPPEGADAPCDGANTDARTGPEMRPAAADSSPKARHTAA